MNQAEKMNQLLQTSRQELIQNHYTGVLSAIEKSIRKTGDKTYTYISYPSTAKEITAKLKEDGFKVTKSCDPKKYFISWAPQIQVTETVQKNKLVLEYS